jgi:hypothetical protein
MNAFSFNKRNKVMKLDEIRYRINEMGNIDET